MQPLIQQIFDGGTPDLNRCVEAWADRFPLLASLKSTRQDPGWHAEGDVHTHTGMVLDALYRFLDDDAWLSAGGMADLQHGWKRVTAVLAAVFHDIAKPLTTCQREIRGQARIVAPHHAATGRSWLAHRLASLQLPGHVFWDVLGLVGAHHEPKFLVIKDKHQGHWHRLAHRVDPRQVYLLELADMRGRICDDRSEQVELIELFRVGCEELGLFHDARNQTRYLWASEIERLVPQWSGRDRSIALNEGLEAMFQGKIAHPQEAVARAYQWRGRRQLHVLCGVSGVGKSTTIERARRPDATIVSLDALREELTGDPSDQSANRKVVHLARERVRAGLREGGTTVVDATNIRRDFRNQWIGLGRDYRALVSLHVLLDEQDQIRDRNKGRSRSVPEPVLSRQLARFELPWRDEAHEVDIWVSGVQLGER